MAGSRSIVQSFIAVLILLVVSLAVWFVSSNASVTVTALFASCVAIAAFLSAYGLILARQQSAQLVAMQDIIRRLNPQSTALENVSAGLTRIQARLGSLEAERDGLKATLTTMEEGVIVVDAQKRILMANAAARKILNMPSREAVGAHLIEMTSQPELLMNVELSLVASQACGFEFQTPAPDENGKCSIMARCAPLHDETHRLSGAVAVLHDITPLRRLERMRTDFVANVSHELRTPLTSLIGYLETLETGGFDDRAQARQFLAICRRQAENLSRIVEDLLRLSRLENPQQEIAATEIDLAEVVTAAVEQFSILARDRRVTLTTDFPDVPVQIRGDRGLLAQAVGNLIENAINYNRENGQVQVRLAAIVRSGAAEGDAGAQWQIIVSDTGIGIPQTALKHVFERFYRVDKARSRDRGGTGLGLAIVKHIALAHGASVHVESEVGKGTTFYMRFKARQPVPSEASHVTA